MHRHGTRALLVCALPLVLATGCGDREVALDRQQIVQLFGREHVVPRAAAPAELVAFGRELYHDARLSKNGNISCASCHDLARHGTDGEPKSPGTDGKRGDRNSPSSVNAFRQVAQFWDGRAADVEAQAQGPVVNPIEHGFATEAEFEAKLASLPGMPERFAALFPGDRPLSLANFGTAVGAFERTLVTTSRFDRWLDGDDSALTGAEKGGLATFVATGCVACHAGRTVGGGMFQKLGLVKPYPTDDVGRAKVTGQAADTHVFKVPMLLGVAETAPYFHDGSVATLEEAVRAMASHQLGKELTEAEVLEIVAFLRALSSRDA
ncbi:MAG: c-type cytochrome [Planctomycetes bacterium]|nr:c-type cytochrome [Planctomycetota bacterium]